MDETETASPASLPVAQVKRGKRGSWWRSLSFGALAGLFLAVGVHAGYMVLGRNFHTVLPGLVYRCAQPSGSQLEQLIRAHGIRTVMNLRGQDDDAWYRDECQVSRRMQVVHQDIGIYACWMPDPQELRRIFEVLDHCDYPLLIHCASGADRTGLVSAIVLLLTTNTTLDQAR